MKIHTVKKTENIRGISLRYAVEEEELLRVNALSLPGPLCPGQSLFIPDDAPEFGRNIEVCGFAASSADVSAEALTYLCLYSHSFDSSGQLCPPALSCNSRALRRDGCAPLLCLANFNSDGGFSPELAHLLFSRPELKAELFDSLLTKLKANEFYGLQLCFNYLFPFDRDNYSAFALELAEILHGEGLMLGIELVPPDSPALSAAQDYAALGKAADRLSLMFCRWGHAFSPPQPIAPLNFIRSGLERICANVPAEKLLLGISGCGFDWPLPWRQGDSAPQISNGLAADKAIALAAEIKYDSRAQAPYYDYSDATAKRRRVYFEDARSIDAKLRLVEEYSLAGISLYSWESALRPGSTVLGQLCSAEKLL